MAQGFSSHTFKMELDVSDVISKLKNLESTASSISSTIGNATKASTVNIPASPTSQDIGRAAGQLTRTATEDYVSQTGTTNKGDIQAFARDFAKALRESLAPVLESFGALKGETAKYNTGFGQEFSRTQQNELVRQVQTAAKVPVTGATTSSAAALTDAQKVEQAENKKAAEAIRNLQRKLGDDIESYDIIIQKTVLEQETQLRDLESRRSVQRAERAAQDQARSSLASRERLRNGDEFGELSQGEAASQTNKAQIGGEAALILLTGNNGDQEAIVQGKHRIADQVTATAGAVAEERAASEDSVRLIAEKNIKLRALNERVKAQEAILDPVPEKPVDPFVGGGGPRPLSPLENAQGAINAQRTATEQALLQQQLTLPEDTANAALAQVGAQRLSMEKELLVLQTQNAGDITLQAGINLQRTRIQEELRTEELKELSSNEALRVAKAERLVAEKQYNLAQRKTNADVAQQAGIGNPLSRLFARFGGPRNGPPGANGGIPDGLDGIFGGPIASIAKFAIPSTILFGGLSAIKSGIKEAEDLERVFADVKAQFNDTFGSGSEQEFENFKKNILEISAATGVTATDLAKIGQQVQAAFGPKSGITIGGKSGDSLVKDQIESAAEISKVTGLSSQEIADSLTAASVDFGVSYRRVADVALSLQDTTGVSAGDTIKLLADIAPAAKNAGFSIEELATVSADVQQKSGQSGSAIAQAFVRSLPAIQDARKELLAFADTNSKLGADYIKGIAGGSTKDIINTVASNFGNLNDDQQKKATELLGGKRSADAIINAFTDPDLASKVAATAGAGDLLKQRFEAISKSLEEDVARLKEKFRQLAVAIFDGGLGTALKDLVAGLTSVVEFLQTMFELFGKINDATGGWITKVGALTAAYFALSAVLKGIAGTNAIGALSGLLGGIGGGAGAAGAEAAVPGSFLNSGQLAALGAGTAARGGLAGFAASGAEGTGLAGSGLFGGAGAVGANVIPILAVAALTAVVVKSVGNGIAKGLENQRQKFTSYTDAQLQSELAKKADFSGNFASDIGDTFHRGLAIIGGAPSDQTDPRQIAIREANKRAFAANGGAAYADNVIQGPSFRGLGTSDAIASVLLGDNASDLVNQNVNDLLSKDVKIKHPGTRGSAGKDTSALQDKLGKDLYEQLAKGTADERLAAYQDLFAAANKGDAEAIQKLILLLGQDPRFKLLIDDYKKKQEENAKTSAIAAAAIEQEQGLEDIKALAAVGGKNAGDVLKALVEQAERDKLALDAVVAAGHSSTQENLTYLKRLQEIQETQGASRARTSDLNQEYFQISHGPGDVTDKNNIDRLTNLLNDDASGIAALDPKTRIAKAKELVKALQGLDKATAIPDSARSALADDELDVDQNTAWATLLNAFATVFGKGSDAIVQTIARDFLLGKLTIAQVEAALKEKIAKLPSVLDDTLTSLGLNAYGGNDAGSTFDVTPILNAIKTFSLVPTTAASSKTDAASKAKELQDAKQDYYKSLIEGDPVLKAQVEVSQAEEDYQSALASGNETDQYKAMAAKVRALRGLEVAKYDVQSSYKDLNSALAQFKGDTVKVANLAVDKAVEDRDRANALFATHDIGEAQKNQAEIALINAKASARDAQLSQQKDDYQFLFDMGQITKQQFIEYLKTLKQIPDLTTAQLRDLDRQIKQLQGDLSADLQFNLPTKFALPTLYEVRRIGQTGSSQAGYVDNRNVTVQINVNNGADQQQMLKVLTDVMGAPPRVSSAGRY